MNRIKTNPETELGVLGILILDGNPKSMMVQNAMLILNEDMFYSPLHRELFNVIKKFFQLEQCFDLTILFGLDVSNEIYNLIHDSIRGEYFSINMIESYLFELKKLYELRGMLSTLVSGIKLSMREVNAEVSQDLLMTAIESAADIATDAKKIGANYEEIGKQFFDNLSNNQNISVQCGIRQFKDVRKRSLITIAGGSGVGKTFFSIYFLHNLVIHQPEKQFLFFSLEMPSVDIWERHLSVALNKPINDLTDNDRNHPLPYGKVFDGDACNMTIERIEAVARIEAMKRPISVIIVDYIALISKKDKYQSNYEHIALASSRLAMLAMSLDCIVIALSQVNRDPAKRGNQDRCPYPEDVADSTGSVRSSGLWLGIDRPDLYNDDADKKNKFVVKCRKSRYGDNFEAFFDFNGGRFAETPSYRDFSSPIKSNRDYLNEIIGNV